MTIMRDRMKNLVRRTVSLAAPPIWKIGRRNRLLILMYHRILPFNHPAQQFEQPGMIVAPETLEMHLAVLREYFELMHLDDWLQRAGSGACLPRMACALTFDDGWKDNYEYAFPILKGAGVPATIYLVSKMVGGTYGFWPTRLARLLCEAWGRKDNRATSLIAAQCPAVVIPEVVGLEEMRLEADRVIGAMKNFYDDIGMRRVVDAVEREMCLTSESDLLTWEQVGEMGESGFIRFGSHTRNHIRLANGVNESKALEEIALSATDLESCLNQPVSGFCYPNGDHCSEVVDIVKRRYAYAVTTQAGWNDRSTDRYLLRRVGVHDDVSNTRAKLIARISIGI